MTKNFPKFAAHNLASCFNCGGDFGDGHWSNSGYAPGRGQFRQYCTKCDHITWYDIKAPLAQRVLSEVDAELAELTAGVSARG
jgi:hypothetical protein